MFRQLSQDARMGAWQQEEFSRWQATMGTAGCALGVPGTYAFIQPNIQGAHEASLDPPAPSGTYLTIRQIQQSLADNPDDPGAYVALARAYVARQLHVVGDMYEALARKTKAHSLEPTMAQKLPLLQALGGPKLLIHRMPLPPQEVTQTRRWLTGRLHSKKRDATAISHHYDVSNTFYEWVLGPSMAYTCACYPDENATLEEAQANKFDLVARKLGLHAGMRLLDVGCGWGGMVRYAARRGVHALGVTLSAEQASWAQQAIARDGLTELAEVRHLDYRDSPGHNYDAVSSIGLTEHVGVHSYPSYFALLLAKLRPGGRLLNHCITQPDNRARAQPDVFIDRYVFPDGELAGAGKIITEAQNAGFELCHVENLREHYALTLKQWCANLAAHWDECVAEVGEATARVWGLYMGASRLSFERNGIQLHQMLAVRPDGTGVAHVPLRPWWR